MKTFPTALGEVACRIKRVIEYKVVAEHDLNGLEKIVNNAIAQGWEPWGNLSVVVPVIAGSAAPMFSQAMVRRQP